MKAPKIRFQGFDGEWEEKKLGEIADKVTKKNIDAKYTETLTNSAERGIISQMTYFDHAVSNIDNITGYYIVENNDFVYNPRISTSAPVGPINRNKLDRTGVMSPLYTVFTAHDIEKSYLEWYFKSSQWHKYMFFHGDTGARADRFSIKDSTFFKMPIPTPCMKEQQRIGSYFSHLDSLITLHQRKSYDLKEVKKYMLQKMFPKKGEKVPEIRFAGFTGDWEEKKLGEIAALITKGTTPKDKSGMGEVNFIKVENINPDSGHISISSKITKEEHEGYLSRSQLQENDILFSIAGTLGRVSVVPKELLPANTNQALAIIRPKEDDISYLITVFRGNTVTDFIQKNPTVGAQPNLSLAQVASLEIPIPEKKEQQKIGSYFSHLDSLITLHQRKADELKTVKKYMLQKMFV